jgi:hypothetical protein
MSGIVREDDEQAGRAEISSLNVHVEADTRIEIWRPEARTSGGTKYMVELGRVYLHMERAELERLHALTGRALESEES